MRFIGNPIFLKLPNSLIEGIGGHMDIPIHGGFDAGVSQQFLQYLWLNPTFDCSCGVSMA